MHDVMELIDSSMFKQGIKLFRLNGTVLENVGMRASTSMMMKSDAIEKLIPHYFPADTTKQLESSLPVALLLTYIVDIVIYSEMKRFE